MHCNYLRRARLLFEVCEPAKGVTRGVLALDPDAGFGAPAVGDGVRLAYADLCH